MNQSDPMGSLAAWYSRHCDSDWEHDWRVRISSLDNPGWNVQINLADTFRRPVEMERVSVNRSDQDWYTCWVEGEVFRGAGGPQNLAEVVIRFLDWIEQYETAHAG